MLGGSNKLFWVRAGFAAIAGIFSGIMNFSNETAWAGFAAMVVFYILSYILAKYVLFKRTNIQRGKLVTTGLGTYIMLFLFFWIFYFTLHISGFV